MHKWAANLANENRSLQVEIYPLFGKILSVESKLSDLNQQLNQALGD